MGRPARDLSEAERRQIRFACPRCGATSGERCVSPNGKPRYSIHDERYRKWLEAGSPGAPR